MDKGEMFQCHKIATGRRTFSVRDTKGIFKAEKAMVSPMEGPLSAIPQNTSSQHLDYNDDEERAQFIQICSVLGEDVDGKYHYLFIP